MSDPDSGPGPNPERERPTTDKSEAKAQGRSMVRHWVGIAVVSILGLWILAIAVMQATGLVAVFAPIAETETETQQWGLLGVLVLVWIALAGWSWSALADQNSH